MKCVIVANYGVKIGYEKGLLVIRKGKEKKHISPTDIEQLILATSGISITTKALRELMRYGIDIVILDSRGTPSARLYLPYITRTVNSRRAQYEAYAEKNTATKYAKSFAKSKIMNQGLYLKYLGKMLGMKELVNEGNEILSYINQLSSIKGEINSTRQEIINIEAKAARKYWGSISIILPKELRFEGRDPDSDDGFNTCLNYLYGALYPEVFKAICLAGLDPYAGFLHVDRSGKPVLTFDFIEMFRVSAADSLLVNMFRSGFRAKTNNGILDYKTRAELIAKFTKWLSRTVKCINGRVGSLSYLIKSYAYLLASFLRSKKSYKGFVERWWS